ncbi:MAG: hypothetical protein QM613_04440 [Micrococcaceae bacterium]
MIQKNQDAFFDPSQAVERKISGQPRNLTKEQMENAIPMPMSGVVSPNEDLEKSTRELKATGPIKAAPNPGLVSKVTKEQFETYENNGTEGPTTPAYIPSSKYDASNKKRE